MFDTITLSHGAGGLHTRKLLESIIFPTLHLASHSDGASVISDGELVISTDSFVLPELFFPGGDIGKLAVTGTCNDLAVMGAQPQYLSLSLIIGEGLPISTLKKLIQSIACSANEIGVKVITGDTKVVEKSDSIQLLVNTTGIGSSLLKWSSSPLTPGDQVLISGPIGQHGITIKASRLECEGDFTSDCQHLWPLIRTLKPHSASIKRLSDPTRGGVLATLYEWVANKPFSIILEAAKIPIMQQYQAFADLLGLEILSAACEGRFVGIIEDQGNEKVLNILRQHQQGRQAAIIGEVTEVIAGKVLLTNSYEQTIILPEPVGYEWPRIC